MVMAEDFAGLGLRSEHPSTQAVSYVPERGNSLPFTARP